MAEKKSTFEKVMGVADLISFGVLAFAIVTANAGLAMASAVDFTGNTIIKQEYKNWKKKKRK